MFSVYRRHTNESTVMDPFSKYTVNAAITAELEILFLPVTLLVLPLIHSNEFHSATKLDVSGGPGHLELNGSEVGQEVWTKPFKICSAVVCKGSYDQQC